jgi:hypothetical protein
MSEDEGQQVDEDVIGEEDIEAVSADQIELNDDQVKLAARIMNVLDKKDDNGEFVYTNTEVRDFVCACIFELGIPITAQLEAAMYSFMDDIPLPDEDNPTPEQLQEGIKKYFTENPLNDDLGAEFAAIAAEATRGQGEGFKNDAAAQNAAKAAAGLSSEKRAPQAESTSPKMPKPKVKKGLS